jgi:hypothetical protein
MAGHDDQLTGCQEPRRERENWEKRSTITHGSAAESAVALQKNVNKKIRTPKRAAIGGGGTPPAHGKIAQNLKKTPDHGGRPPTGKTRGPSRPRRATRDLGWGKTRGETDGQNAARSNRAKKRPRERKKVGGGYRVRGERTRISAIPRPRRRVRPGVRVAGVGELGARRRRRRFLRSGGGGGLQGKETREERERGGSAEQSRGEGFSSCLFPCFLMGWQWTVVPLLSLSLSPAGVAV